MAYYVLTFENTSQAIKFEGLWGKMQPGEGERILIPVPRSISSSCGLAAKIETAFKEEALGIIRSHNIGVEAFYRFEKKGRDTVIKKEEWK
ncbi:MAG: DUF3343 domain-containing protein [Dethiobacteria bacterium]|jgi:hypothetical protein|nr:DUF3343 domain-containing protein [Bacillota bacterium]